MKLRIPAKNISQVFQEHVVQAAEMNARAMDCHPGAKFPFARPGSNLALIAYPDGIWVVETHGQECSDQFEKLELVTEESWLKTPNT